MGGVGDSPRASSSWRRIAGSPIRAVQWWWRQNRRPVAAELGFGAILFYNIFGLDLFKDFYRDLFAGLPVLPTLAWLWAGVTFAEIFVLPYLLGTWLFRRLEGG